MTVEAALTKLSYLLGQPNLTVKTIREVYTVFKHLHYILRVLCISCSENAVQFER